MTDEEFSKHYKRSKPQKWDSGVIVYGLGPIKSSAALELVHKAGYKKYVHLLRC